jgi:hypothetical protein
VTADTRFLVSYNAFAAKAGQEEIGLVRRVGRGASAMKARASIESAMCALERRWRRAGDDQRRGDVLECESRRVVIAV